MCITPFLSRFSVRSAPFLYLFRFRIAAESRGSSRRAASTREAESLFPARATEHPPPPPVLAWAVSDGVVADASLELKDSAGMRAEAGGFGRKLIALTRYACVVFGPSPESVKVEPFGPVSPMVMNVPSDCFLSMTSSTRGLWIYVVFQILTAPSRPPEPSKLPSRLKETVWTTVPWPRNVASSSP